MATITLGFVLLLLKQFSRPAAEELMRQAHDKVIVDANGEILTKEKSGSFASKKQGLMDSRMSHQTKLVNTIASVIL